MEVENEIIARIAKSHPFVLFIYFTDKVNIWWKYVKNEIEKQNLWDYLFLIDKENFPIWWKDMQKIWPERLMIKLIIHFPDNYWDWQKIMNKMNKKELLPFLKRFCDNYSAYWEEEKIEDIWEED